MKAINSLGKSVKKFTDKNSPVVLIEESNYFSFTFFILGAIVGAFTALLYTPDTGENNRKKLAEKFNDLNEDKEKNIGKKSYKIREITDSGVRNLEEERENLTQF